jgi:hypothetical protein
MADLGGDLRKLSFGLICTLAALLAGCGGSGDEPAKKTAGGRAACSKAVAEQKHYHQVALEQGPRFFDKVRGAKTIAATKAFRASVEQLEKSSSSTEKRKLAKLAEGLSRQEKVLSSFAVRDIAAAQAAAKGLDPLLFEGLASLKKICGA